MSKIFGDLSTPGWILMTPPPKKTYHMDSLRGWVNFGWHKHGPPPKKRHHHQVTVAHRPLLVTRYLPPEGSRRPHPPHHQQYRGHLQRPCFMRLTSFLIYRCEWDMCEVIVLISQQYILWISYFYVYRIYLHEHNYMYIASHSIVDVFSTCKMCASQIGSC